MKLQIYVSHKVIRTICPGIAQEQAKPAKLSCSQGQKGPELRRHDEGGHACDGLQDWVQHEMASSVLAFMPRGVLACILISGHGSPVLSCLVSSPALFDKPSRFTAFQCTV
eukprot:1161561-Pelagomonas_calceolata.AAC.9